MRLTDQDPMGGAEHVAALVENDLHVPRVLAEVVPQRGGALAGEHCGERADPALGLGDDLVGDDQDVAVAKPVVTDGEDAGDELREVIAWSDLRHPRERRDGQARAGLHALR
jgi:hypothetical protein